jgi:hypothetical protein
MTLNDVNEDLAVKLKIESDQVANNGDQSMDQEIAEDLNESSDFVQLKGRQERVLTEEEAKKLENDKYLVSEFKHKRFEIDAKKNWDLFYRRLNSLNCFYSFKCIFIICFSFESGQE